MNVIIDQPKGTCFRNKLNVLCFGQCDKLINPISAGRAAYFYPPEQLWICIDKMKSWIEPYTAQQKLHSKSDDGYWDIDSPDLHIYLVGKSGPPNQHMNLERKLWHTSLFTTISIMFTI